MMSTPKTAEESEALWDQVAAGTAAPPEPTPEPSAPAPGPAQTDDPLANSQVATEVTQDGRTTEPKAGDDELQKLQKQLHQLSSNFGRLQSDHRRLQAVLAEPQAKPAAPSQSAVNDALTSPEKFEQLKADYPDIAAGIEALVDSRISSVRLPSDVVTRRDLEQDNARREYQDAVDAIGERFPNWVNDVKSDDFRAWLDVQPPEVRLLAESEDPGHAMRLIEIREWTKTNSAPQGRSVNPRLRAAAQPSRARGAPVAEGELQGEALWNHMASQQAA